MERWEREEREGERIEGGRKRGWREGDGEEELDRRKVRECEGWRGREREKR